jgi:hypothetical protein
VAQAACSVPEPVFGIAMKRPHAFGKRPVAVKHRANANGPPGDDGAAGLPCVCRCEASGWLLRAASSQQQRTLTGSEMNGGAIASEVRPRAATQSSAGGPSIVDSRPLRVVCIAR